MMTRLVAAERGRKRSVVERVEGSVTCSRGDGATFRARIAADFGRLSPVSAVVAATLRAFT